MKQKYLQKFAENLQTQRSPNTYEDIERVIKDIITTKIKREHVTNYLKHSFKIYKK